MTVRETLAVLWHEMLTPSRRDEAPYLAVLIATAHAMVGAAAVTLLPWAALPAARAGLPVGYWLVKERGDLRRGGTVLDGLTDAGFVALGAFYGQALWAPTVLVLAVAVTVARSQSSRSKPVETPADGGTDA